MKTQNEKRIDNDIICLNEEELNWEDLDYLYQNGGGEWEIQFDHDVEEGEPYKIYALRCCNEDNYDEFVERFGYARYDG